MHDCVKQVVARLMETGLATASTLQGCSNEEIESLEAKLSIRLPTCYKDFLSIMGRCAGKFMVGTDYSFDKLPGFREAAERMMTENNVTSKMPDTAFVFVSHQGYTFLFFDICSSNDPPVFMYTENESEPKQIADTFSGWLKSAVDDDIEAYRELT